ncbi:MAG TPA: hypothetical protein VEH04_00340 [Verrucomicrobiae bacterium]|nr:hypothetical protein [Verrucomicrobiae bacterium]
MKITKILTVAAAVTLVGQVAQAQDTAHVWNDPRGWWGNHFVYDAQNTSKFTAHELNLDLFGSYWAGQEKVEDVFDTNIRRGTWGGGIGLNYFLTREIGFGGDLNISDNDGNFIDSASGSLIARFPIESVGLAPYIFGGGTRLTDRHWEWAGHAGIGLEFRPNPITGIFADARYLWPDDSGDSLLLRAGLRLVF